MRASKASKGFLISCLLILLLAANLVGAQLADPDTLLAEAPPAYSQAEADAALKEVLPLVQEITGRKLKRVPPIRLVTRKQFVAGLTKADGQQGSSGSRGQKRVPPEQRIPARVGYPFGVYEPFSNVIYLLPGNFGPRLERAGVPGKYYGPILKMVVAHELTHALQSQEVWSNKAYSSRVRRDAKATRSRSTQVVQVVRAVTEGHATFVMDRVAEKLGFPDAIPEFHKTISVGLVEYTDQKHQKENAEIREQNRRAYLDGERFIEWHYKRGGKKRVWEVLKNPPAEWSVIEKPEESTRAQTK